MRVTRDMIDALTVLRAEARHTEFNNVRYAIDLLDNAGAFAAVDEAADYHAEPPRLADGSRVEHCTAVYETERKPLRGKVLSIDSVESFIRVLWDDDVQSTECLADEGTNWKLV